MRDWYYIKGNRIYCKGEGSREKGKALQRVVSGLKEGNFCYFWYEKGGWLFLKGKGGWLCLPLSEGDLPEEIRFKIMAVLDGIEKEVEKKWQLL